MPSHRVPTPPQAGGRLRLERAALVCAALALLVRLLTLPTYPVCDRTEARYGELARAMAASGDVVTPRLGGAPFWGKPPLSTWCQAASLHVLGATPLALRLPGWLALVLAAAFLRAAGRWYGGPRVGRLAATLWMTCPLVLALAGAVMTDPFLAAGLAWALFGALRGRLGPDGRRAAITAGTHLGLGAAVAVLAKGPIGLLFAAVPVAWGWRRGRRAHALVGLAVVLPLAVPWFVLAERATPGFLDYFLLGEHLHRYLDPAWSGDRYGGPHAMPRGTVWLYAALAVLPWLPVVLRQAWTARPRAVLADPGRRMLAGAALAPLVLFTLASGLLPTYVLPALGPLALLAGRRLAAEATADPRYAARSLCWVPRAMLLLTALVGVVALALPPRTWASVTHEAIVRAAGARVPVYARSLEFLYSARFYSGGRAREAHDADDPVWELVRAQPAAHAVVVKGGRRERIPRDVRARLVLLARPAPHYEVFGVAVEGAP